MPEGAFAELAEWDGKKSRPPPRTRSIRSCRPCKDAKYVVTRSSKKIARKSPAAVHDQHAPAASIAAVAFHGKAYDGHSTKLYQGVQLGHEGSRAYHLHANRQHTYRG